HLAQLRSQVGMVRTVKLSSRARSPPTCRCRRRPSTSWSSTSRPPRRLAWKCRRRRSAAPTRGSSDHEEETAIAGRLVTGASHAQTDFPNGPIHMAGPYPAGGIVDIATRIVTDKLSEISHQPIVVEAKPGASGNLAWDQVSRAKPEGYTRTFHGPATMANPH